MNNLELELFEQATDVLGWMEELVTFYCDEEIVSGQRVWTMISCLASIKANEYPEED